MSVYRNHKRYHRPTPFPNDFPSTEEYTLLVGPDRTKFTVRTQLFNLYAPRFTHQVSAWPGLAPHAAQIVLRFISDMYRGQAGLGGFDVQTLKYCFDVYDCANTWGVQSVKDHVCRLLSASNLLSRIDDYDRFLTQAYQFYVQAAPFDRNAMDAITKCLRTISSEHERRPGTSRGTQRSKHQAGPGISEEMFDIFRTESARLHRQCGCDFCKDQRAYMKGEGRARFNVFKAARADFIHEVKRIWTLGLEPMDFLGQLLFNYHAVVFIAVLYLFVGYESFLNQLFKVLSRFMLYFFALICATFLLALVIFIKYLVHEGTFFLGIPKRTLKWMAWKVVPLSTRGFLKSLGCVMLYFLFKVYIDFSGGNGPFDTLTRMALREMPKTAWTRIFQFYTGVTSPEQTTVWASKYEKYLEEVQKRWAQGSIQN